MNMIVASRCPVCGSYKVHVSILFIYRGVLHHCGMAWHGITWGKGKG